MTKKFLSSILTCFVTCASAHAAIQPIFTPIPGQGAMAAILLQGIAPIPGGEIDPEVRALYDSIAAPTQTVPGSGKGKVISVKDKAFSLSCAEATTNHQSVNCTIVVKSTTRSQVNMGEQTAETSITGEDAQTLFQFFAGKQTDQTYEWKSTNGWIQIESTRDQFHFKFSEH